VLVMGATPELIDMLLTEGVARIAALDLHPETMEAMRRLGSQDWSRVQLVAGDWRHPRQAWHSAFDLVLCDGGLMFLPFPDDWRTVLVAVHGYLRPGGRLVTRMSSVSPTEVGFRESYDRAIVEFDSERSALDPEQQASRFAELLSRVRGMCRYGAVDPEGRVQLPLAVAARRWMAEDLQRRYPEFDRIVQTISGRSNLLGTDGTAIVAVPALERVTGEMARCGFDVEVLQSIHSPPKHWFTISATRRTTQMG
jgi:hypothetical protein